MSDVLDAHKGTLAASNIRTIDVDDALVDTGAWGLSIPKSQIEKLGLIYLKTRPAMTAAGPVEVRMFRLAKLTVQDRDCPMDVTEVPDGCPVLIGQIPLEWMDFVVDPKNRKIIGNPAHGGEQVIELFPLWK